MRHDRAHYEARLEHVRKLARAELERFRALYPAELAGWAFAWNRNRTRFGVCRYDVRRIELSGPLAMVEPDDARILNTVRHEIAHALAGHAAGHGERWRAWARRCGCTRIGACGSASAGAEKLPHRWELVVDRGDGSVEVVRTYHARPKRDFVDSLPQRHLRGRPETRGKLRLRWWSAG
ncbi:SprT-like domain-containing protein [Amaricoccus sp.]|uniref:SprT-like domain-containing protein n=1 Tax=Amaricoccus sp. TaxID=1872485 RepID=UPI001B66C8AB|nr:SprT-like domain-containing protein [Amaricoccus sp.]MBP7003371.1 SprT-like domain-containing protein [Amaricoccus sp.]